jgi:hypothetical protein
MQVCICHPVLVQTGLDCLWANTLIFAQTGYSIYVLRQASRRSWRIGQTKPVKVKYLAYAGSMQENCLRLMGKKLLVSLALEGKFQGQGLQSLEEDDDMLTAMARELVTQKGVGERADDVWRRIQAERTRTLGPEVSAVLNPECELIVSSEDGLVVPSIEIGPPVAAPSLAQLSMAPRRSRRRPAYSDENQLSLGL